MWPIWIVVGVVAIAAMISMIYMWWLQNKQGYEPLPIESDKLIPILRIGPDARNGSAGEIGGVGGGDDGIILVYRSESGLSPVELDSKVIARIHAEYPDYSIKPLPIPLEPGYNAFRIGEKQMNWYRGAFGTPPTSIFHVMTIPLELFVRWTFLPTWMLIDFVDHIGKCYAALIVPTDAIKRGLKYTVPKLNLIEGHDSLYTNSKGAMMLGGGGVEK
jgi:hypothetical protein